MMKNNQCFWPYLRKSPAQIMATKVGITSQYMIWVPKPNQTNSTALSQVFPHKDLLGFISMFFFFDKKKHILPLYPAELVDIVQVYWETNTRLWEDNVCAMQLLYVHPECLLVLGASLPSDRGELPAITCFVKTFVPLCPHWEKNHHSLCWMFTSNINAVRWNIWRNTAEVACTLIVRSVFSKTLTVSLFWNH